MAQETTAAAVGMREDLSNVIYNISPTETPFMTMCGRGRATAINHEWQTDALTVPAENRVAEGAAVSTEALARTVKINNYTQISQKGIEVTGTYEAVDKAGRKSELAYQIAKRGKEMKREIELMLTDNVASDGASLTRIAGGLAAWIATTTSLGATNSDTGGHDGTATVDARSVDGDLRALTEAMLKGVIRDVWNEGGDPTTILVDPVHKQNISAFTGNTTRFDRSEDKRLVTAIDIYVSDFGEHRVVPDRFLGTSSALGDAGDPVANGVFVFVLTPRMWSVDYLRSFRQWEIAKAGDAEIRQLLSEYTLRSSNEAASGSILDLNAA